jgi:mediator of RNA polymerase II transcription subunit 17, fungi type
MAESLLLPIRPNGRRGPENSDLAATLRQIDVQKGAFRHVTELTLLDELHRTEAGIEEIETEDESGDEDEDESDEIPASRQEKVWKAREEMLKQLE